MFLKLECWPACTQTREKIEYEISEHWEQASNLRSSVAGDWYCCKIVHLDNSDYCGMDDFEHAFLGQMAFSLADTGGQISVERKDLRLLCLPRFFGASQLMNCMPPQSVLKVCHGLQSS